MLLLAPSPLTSFLEVRPTALATSDAGRTVRRRPIAEREEQAIRTIATGDTVALDYQVLLLAPLPLTSLLEVRPTASAISDAGRTVRRQFIPKREKQPIWTIATSDTAAMDLQTQKHLKW
jgi:hypothetical protein